MSNLIIDEVVTVSIQNKLQYLISLIKKSVIEKTPYIIGITGPPGVGKTTTAKILHEYISNMGIVSYRAGLEDFYFSKEKREQMGIKWRALPGTHDTVKLIDLLHGVKNKNKIQSIPRYSMVNDIPLSPTKIENVIDCFILEGWFLISNINEYDRITEYIDYLIYLDADIRDVKKWRFQREETYRTNFNGGYTTEQMNDFWDNALEPGINNWVVAQKNKANLIIRFDSNHNVL